MGKVLKVAAAVGVIGAGAAAVYALKKKRELDNYDYEDLDDDFDECVACDTEDIAEEAADAVEEKAEDVAESAEEALDKVEDTVEEIDE